ncbi:hypothetical protein ACTFIZ_007793 [Dictyostelium cf. discoideum]
MDDNYMYYQIPSLRYEVGKLTFYRIAKFIKLQEKAENFESLTESDSDQLIHLFILLHKILNMSMYPIYINSTDTVTLSYATNTRFINSKKGMVGFVDATPNNVDSLLEPYLECSFLKENYDLIKDNNDVLFYSYSIQQKGENINGKRVTYKKANDFIVEHFPNNISSLNFLFSAELKNYLTMAIDGTEKDQDFKSYEEFHKLVVYVHKINNDCPKKFRSHLVNLFTRNKFTGKSKLLITKYNKIVGYINQHGLKTTASVPNSNPSQNINTPKSTSSQTVEEETDEETDDEDRTQDENNGTANNTQSNSGGTPSSQSSHSTNKKSVLSNFKNGYQAPEPNRVYPTVLATSGSQLTSKQIQNEIRTSNLVDKQHHESVKTKVHETLQNTFLIKNELLKVTKKSNELKEKHLEIFQKQGDHSQQVIDILKSLCDSVKQLVQDVETIDDHLPRKRSRHTNQEFE